LFGAYDLDLPHRYLESDLGSLARNDTIPSNIDNSTISYLGEFLSAPLASSSSNARATVKLPNNGKGISIDWRYNDIGDQQWTTLETIVLRLLITGTISGGRFPVTATITSPDAVAAAEIGFDAAVCVQRYEPWIVEAYNTSIASPSALRVVGKGYNGTSPSPSGDIRGAPIENTRYLNTTAKSLVFDLAFVGSIDKVTEGNGVDTNYVPSPTVGPVTLPRSQPLF